VLALVQVSHYPKAFGGTSESITNSIITNYEYSAQSTQVYFCVLFLFFSICLQCLGIKNTLQKKRLARKGAKVKIRKISLIKNNPRIFHFFRKSNFFISPLSLWDSFLLHHRKHSFKSTRNILWLKSGCFL